MKKLVLILVSAVILTVFIAFNYLLWDRENKIKNFEYINDTKNSSIDTLSTEIRNLKNDNDQLKARIAELEDTNEEDRLKNSELENQKNDIDKELQQKKEVINMLAQQTELKPLEDAVRKWAEGVDKGQLDIAYNLQYNHSLSKSKSITFDEFGKNYKNSVKSLKIKSIKQVTEELPADKKGSIVFKVGLEVKKVENSSSNLFNEGVNDRYFFIDYDTQKKEWVITDILDSI